MGSQFFDLHLAEPAALATRLRGDQPDLVEQLERLERGPPSPSLRPAFELMARGTFVFLAKGREHPEGLSYCRAFEYLLAEFGQRRWGIEFYPDEDEGEIWTLVFGRCEAEWLDLPVADTGIATIAWRSLGRRRSAAARAASDLASTGSRSCCSRPRATSSPKKRFQPATATPTREIPDQRRTSVECGGVQPPHRPHPRARRSRQPRLQQEGQRG